MRTAFSTEAVIIFFVLSGLIMTLSVQRKPRTAGKFIRQRLVRVYPIYLFAVALAGMMAVLIGGRLSDTSWFGNLLFLQTLSGNIVSPPSTNPPLWSLSYEMTYYAFFAVSL